MARAVDVAFKFMCRVGILLSLKSEHVPWLPSAFNSFANSEISEEVISHAIFVVRTPSALEVASDGEVFGVCFTHLTN